MTRPRKQKRTVRTVKMVTEPLLRPRAFARAANLQNNSVYDMIREGRLRAFKVDGGPAWGVPKSELAQYLREVRKRRGRGDVPGSEQAPIEVKRTYRPWRVR